MGETNDLQNLNDEQYLQGNRSGQPISFAAATDSFIAGSSSGQNQESNPGPSNRYYQLATLVSDSLQNQNNLSSDDQYPQGSRSGETMSLEAATNNVAGSSSGQYKEALPSIQYDPGSSNQYHQLAPLVSDGLQNQNNLMSDEQYLASFPAGYRFHPKDLELVGYYLLRKFMGYPLPKNIIRDINVYQHDPDVLTGFFPLRRETEWYFFSSRQRKYQRGNRPDRATPGGFWKPTGAVTDICDRRGKVLAKKTVLDFYKGKSKDGEKNEGTTWKMHEYVLPKDDATTTAPSNNGNDMLLDKVVLCKIYQFNAPNGSNPPTATGTDLQGDGSTNSTTCEQRENHSPRLPNHPTADPQGSHSGQPISLARATNNIAGSPDGQLQESFPSTQHFPVPGQGDTSSAAATNNIRCFPDRSTRGGYLKHTGGNTDIRGKGKVVDKTIVLDLYNGKETKQRNWSTNWNSTVPGNNRLFDDLRRATGRSCYLQGDGSSSSTTPSANPQGGHFGLPISSAPATDNITGFSGGLCEESFRSMQHNQGPSNQNHLALLASGLEVTSLAAATMNNIPDFPSEQYQEPFSPTQYNLGPSNQYHQPAPLVTGLEGTSFTESTNNTTVSLQGDGQPISFAPDDMAGFPSWQCQEYSYSMQHNQGPSNQNQSALLESGLGVTSLAATTNNFPSFPSEQFQEPFSSTQFNLGPSNQYHQPASLVSTDNTAVYLEGDGQPIRFAPDDMAGFPNMQCQEYSYSMQYNNHEPSNQNQSALLESGLGVTSLAATTNNFPSFPSEQFQEPFTSTQYNSGPSYQNHQPASLVSGLADTSFADNVTGSPSRRPHQESFPSTQCNMGNLNPYQLAHLELAQGGTWFGTTENMPNVTGNLDQEQIPLSITGNHDDNNGNPLPSDLDHRQTDAPAFAYLDDLVNELQDPNLWIPGSFNNTDGKG